MASANPEGARRAAVSAATTLVISVVLAYLGNRYGMALASLGGTPFEHVSDAFTAMWPQIAAAPLSVSAAPVPMLSALAMFVIVWLIWLRYAAFFGTYRTGEESGSARWGTVREGRAFKDLENPDNNLLFTENFGLALHRRGYDPEHDRNLNVLVVGGSGSGKTFSYVTPNLCQLNTDFFVTDPKGTLLPQVGYLFTDNGWKVKSFNTIDFSKSMHWNPLKLVRTDTDILSFVNCFILNTNGTGNSSDPFWEKSERLLYSACIALLRDWFPKRDYNLPSLLKLIAMAKAKEGDESYRSPLDLLFLQIQDGKRYIENAGAGQPVGTPKAGGLSRSLAGATKAQGQWSWEPSKFRRNSDGLMPAKVGGLSDSEDFGLLQYNQFKSAAGKTLKSIIISCNVRLAPIATDGVRELLSDDEMELEQLGDADSRTAVFAIMSDTDKTFSFLHAMMMWQNMDQLCKKALVRYGGKLPRPVHYVFDEFANIGKIPQIEQTIAVTRSRNIGITIILQSLAQLKAAYEKEADIIVDCCDTTLFLGGKSNSTNEEIAKMIGKQTIKQMTFNESSGQSSSASKNQSIQGRDLIDSAEIGKMSRTNAILLIAGTNPLMDAKIDPRSHPRYCYVVDDGVGGDRLHKEPFDFVAYRESLAAQGDSLKKI